MKYPTVHLNGTSGEALFEQNYEASKAIREALEVLREAAPNGRDYYPQGPGAFEQAVTEFRKQSKTLYDAQKYFEAIALNVQDQMDAHRRR